MDFQTVYPCKGNGRMCWPYVLASGDITASSGTKLKIFLKKEFGDASPRVCFDSLGGSLVGGVSLGETIRSLGLNTCLLNVYDEEVPSSGVYGEAKMNVISGSPECSSACAFALFGGVKRFVETNGQGMSKLGVHQFYAKGGLGGGTAQAIAAELNMYLDSMGIDRGLLDLASLTPPDEIHYLSKASLVELGIDSEKQLLESWRLETMEGVGVVGFVNQPHPTKDNVTSLVVYKDNQRAFMLIIGRFNKVPLQRKHVEAAFENLSTTIIVDGTPILEQSSVNWSLDGDTAATVLSLSPVALAALENGTKLRIQTDMARVFYPVSPDTYFSLSGFKGISRYILR